MELEKFVAEALLQVTRGVTRAKGEATVLIAPAYDDGDNDTSFVDAPNEVSFEVAVTTTKEGGGGIKVFSIGEASGKVSSEQLSKISFAVPVFFQTPKK